VIEQGGQLINLSAKLVRGNDVDGVNIQQQVLFRAKDVVLGGENRFLIGPH